MVNMGGRIICPKCGGHIFQSEQNPGYIFYCHSCGWVSRWFPSFLDPIDVTQSDLRGRL